MDTVRNSGRVEPPSVMPEPRHGSSGRRELGAVLDPGADGKFPGLLDTVLSDAGIETVLSRAQMPRMNPVMEREVQTCRRELLDRTLIRNQRHFLYSLRELEHSCSEHRPTGLSELPYRRARYPDRLPILSRSRNLDACGQDRLGGTLNEYRHAA